MIGLYLVRWSDGSPVLPLEPGDTLSYETGRTVSADANNDGTAEQVTEWRGGYVIVSPVPVSAPVDTALVQIDTTPAMAALLHSRLIAQDARLGLYAVIEE